MDLLQSITLGLIQGTTEWFPISSTGHLRLAEHFFGLQVPLLFDVVLHVGTLFVTLVFFRETVKNVLLALWRRNIHSGDGKLIVPITVGSIPTAIIALLIGNDLDTYFNTLPLLAAGFLVSGAVLAASKFVSERQDSISVPVALLVGIMQGLSIVPSLSRSGLTIAVMLLFGVKREIAFKFSFLLSLPAVLGALGLTLYQEHNTFSLAGIGMLEIVVSLAVTVAVSFIALKILWKTLEAKKFYIFAVYCFAVGALLYFLSLTGF